MTSVALAVEDLIQEEVVRRLIGEFGREMTVSTVYGKRGASFIDSNARRYAEAAAHRPFIVLRDLDGNDCPPALARRLLPLSYPRRLLFAVAVREVEAWLIADIASLRQFLSVRHLDAPDPEELSDPKRFIADAAARSRRREIREDVGRSGTVRVGRLYNTHMVDFVRNHWRPVDAGRRAPSLSRFLERLRDLT